MDCDVVVVGGGPAGAAAAIAARAAGLVTCLIERDAQPRTRPGEAAHPGIEPLLARLGVDAEMRDAGFLRHTGMFVKWGDEPLHFAAFGADGAIPWRGFQLWRPTFDAILLDAAARDGVALVRPCRDARPVIENGHVVGVATSDRTIRARFVIDASGRQRWLARHLRLPVERAGPRMIAWFGYMSGNCPARDAAPALVSDDEGWTWTARVRSGVYQWIRIAHRNARPSRGWRPQEFATLAAQGEARGIDVTWTRVQPAAGPGYFLTGDAAFVLDPASSHGLLKAIMSGMAAAHHAASIQGGDLDPAAGASAFDAWMAHWFRHECAALRTLYGRVGSGEAAPSMTAGDLQVN
jgi:flavin-dependent dehydrogenase